MTPDLVRPKWLRPVVVAAVVALHFVAFLGTRTAVVVPASGAVEIDVVMDRQAIAEPTPEETPTTEARSEAPPPPPEDEPVTEPPPPMLPPTDTPEPTAPAQPEPRIAEPQPPKSVVEKPRPPRPKKTVKPRRKPEPEMSTAAEESSARAARIASTAEAEDARRAAARSYGSLVSAELQRHRIYPAAARAAGLTGVATVAFVVGPGGRIASHHLVRSTGHSVLDEAVHRIMASVNLPPPPGGIYRSSVPIRFEVPR